MSIDHRKRGNSTSDSATALLAASDVTLIEAIAIGNTEAMRVLYKRYGVDVYRFISRLIAVRHLAEDLVSEVFLEVWQHADHFEGRSKVSTWLLSISRFKALSVLRQRYVAERAKHRNFDQIDVERMEDQADNPEEAALKKDACALMRACVNKLSAEHREIIDLIYYHEKTIEEVAQIIRAPRNTVKTRAHYARKHLARLLAAHEGFDRRRLLQAA